MGPRGTNPHQLHGGPGRFTFHAGSDGAPEHTGRECEREASYRQWFQCVPCRCTSSRSCNDGLQTTGLLAGTTPDEVRGGRHEQRGDGRLTKHHRVMSFGRQEGRFFYQTKAWKRPKQGHRSKGELRHSWLPTLPKRNEFRVLLNSAGQSVEWRL